MVVDFYIRVRIGYLRLCDFYLEVNLYICCVANETRITILQNPEKSRIAGMDAHRHAANFNDKAETVDFSGEPWQRNPNSTLVELLTFAATRVFPQAHEPLNQNVEPHLRQLVHGPAN